MRDTRSEIYLSTKSLDELFLKLNIQTAKDLCCMFNGDGFYLGRDGFPLFKLGYKKPDLIGRVVCRFKGITFQEVK